jgi:hypothetical protein
MREDYPATLLLVEDDPGHAHLIERNLQRAHLPFAIVLLRDGQAALDYLFPSQEASGVLSQSCFFESLGVCKSLNS